jgi:hypothetical protein
MNPDAQHDDAEPVVRHEADTPAKPTATVGEVFDAIDRMHAPSSIFQQYADARRKIEALVPELRMQPYGAYFDTSPESRDSVSAMAQAVVAVADQLSSYTSEVSGEVAQPTAKAPNKLYKRLRALLEARRKYTDWLHSIGNSDAGRSSGLKKRLADEAATNEKRQGEITKIEREIARYESGEEVHASSTVEQQQRVDVARLIQDIRKKYGNIQRELADAAQAQARRQALEAERIAREEQVAQIPRPPKKPKRLKIKPMKAGIPKKPATHVVDFSEAGKSASVRGKQRPRQALQPSHVDAVLRSNEPLVSIHPRHAQGTPLRLNMLLEIPEVFMQSQIMLEELPGDALLHYSTIQNPKRQRRQLDYAHEHLFVRTKQELMSSMEGIGCTARNHLMHTHQMSDENINSELPSVNIDTHLFISDITMQEYPADRSKTLFIGLNIHRLQQTLYRDLITANNKTCKEEALNISPEKKNHRASDSVKETSNEKIPRKNGNNIRITPALMGL